MTVHIAIFDARFIEVSTKGGHPLRPETECGIVGDLPAGDEAHTSDHIDMLDGHPNQPVVTCSKCIENRAAAIARVEAILQRHARRPS